MSARLLLLCPGQGGQHEGMNDLVLAEGEGQPGAALLGALTVPAGSLFENRVAQPAVVAATLAMWQSLQPRLARLRLAPALVAGYSVGELSAYGVAGAFDGATTVALAGARAALMDAAAAAGHAHTLAAIGGLALAQAGALAARHGFAIAIINGHDSCVVGGPTAQLAALASQLTLVGARLQALPVTVAAHTPLLAGAVAPFAALLEHTAFAPLLCPVLCGVDAVPVFGAHEKARAVDALARQLAATIDWAGCMDAAAEAGMTIALELGPGAALSRMLQARHPHIACRSVAEFRSLDGVEAWIARQTGRA
ncbi:ACP S-malonyltransferase [Massilia sp. DWR3-1-1]|uniref:ACP S-malonyltransferase n=1 Tax=Massilia sp. DWR3-1-1 TaxID=2804559 RepID=UPI003CEDE0EB